MFEGMKRKLLFFSFVSLDLIVSLSRNKLGSSHNLEKRQTVYFFFLIFVTCLLSCYNPTLVTLYVNLYSCSFDFDSNFFRIDSKSNLYPYFFSLSIVIGVVLVSLGLKQIQKSITS